MLGAIVGDIVGSWFEWNNIKTKDFNLFTVNCFATDDSIMTLAIAQALLGYKHGEYDKLRRDTIEAMIEVGRPYPDSGYGTGFFKWLYGNEQKPYNSCVNGDDGVRLLYITYRRS